MNQSGSKLEFIEKNKSKRTVLKKLLTTRESLDKRYSLNEKKPNNFLCVETMNNTLSNNDSYINNSEIPTPRGGVGVPINNNINNINNGRLSLNANFNVNFNLTNTIERLNTINTSVIDKKVKVIKNSKVNNNNNNNLNKNNFSITFTPRIQRRENKGLTISNTISTIHTLNNNKNNIQNNLNPFKKTNSKNSQLDSKRNSITNFNLTNNNTTPLLDQINPTIKVMVRFRPLNEIESDLIKSNIGYLSPYFPNNKNVLIKNDNFMSQDQSSNFFTLDRVFEMNSTQEELYDIIGKETINDVLNGYNGTIFTYGQSGTGKTYTMYGSDIYEESKRGIVPRVIQQIFESVEHKINSNTSVNYIFQVKLSILQIYKETLYDLLTGEKDLKIKESPIRGTYVEGLSEVFIDSVDSFFEYLEFFQERRVVCETKLNQNSSRSHSILIIEITQTAEDLNNDENSNRNSNQTNSNNSNQNITKKGTLNLVDLAGSEKVSKTGAVGENLEQAKKINLSLSALGNVIHALSSDKPTYVPYKDSKLTRILKESLGGNYKTSLIVTCSPHSFHLEETISSLKFAQRAKTIKNNVKMNIKLSYEELQKIITQLKFELVNSNTKFMKLRKLAQLDVIEDENLISKDCNDYKFNECEIHQEKIDFLSSQNEICRSELKEKDEIILKLEEEIKKLKDKNSLFTNDNIFANFNPKFEEDKTNLNDLYNDLNYKFNFIVERYKFCENKIFTKLSNSSNFIIGDKNNILKENINQLNLYHQVNLITEMNKNLNIQNEFLQQENQLLINSLEEILKSNYDLYHNSINNNINNNVINSLYQSFKQSFVNPNSSENIINEIINEPNGITQNFTNKKPLARKSSLRIEKFITRKNLNIIKNLHNQREIDLVEKEKENGITNIYTNKEEIIKFKKTEKKLSKLKILQEFIVKSMKENENLKQIFCNLKDEFKNEIKKVSDEVIEHNKISTFKNVNNCNDCNDKIEETITNRNNFDIEDIINDYVDSGSATRKLDGIALKYINNKIRWHFNGGLNAENLITKKILMQHLDNIKADNSVKLEESYTTNN